MRVCLTYIFILSSILAESQNFDEFVLEIPGSKRPLTMTPISGGAFKMGSAKVESGRKADEGPIRSVKVEDFWMGIHEITWEQYEAFVYRNSNSEKFAKAETLKSMRIDGISSATTPYLDMSFGMGKEGYPAVNITHYAAIMYCKWLSAKTGYFYRLPTEAEWEYVCKQGTERVYTFGNNPDQLKEYAVIESPKYKKVGSLAPNDWGIYDIHGNVAEWTMDQYTTYSSKASKDNPWVRPKSLYPRVARGGSWKSKGSDSRCSSRLASQARWKQRDPQLPKSRWWLTNAPFVGFRIVRPLVTPSSKEIEKFWLEAMDDYGQ